MRLIYTLGPSSLKDSLKIIEAGADAVRLTFSFGTPDLQADRASMVKSAGSETSKEVVTIADLAGGGARIGGLKTSTGQEAVDVKRGEKVLIFNQAEVVISNEKKIAIPSQSVYSSIDLGQTISIGDEGVFLSIDEIDQNHIVATSLYDCSIQANRSLFIQGNTNKPECLTTKDLKDLEYIAGSPVFDYVALSFVDNAKDIQRAREVLSRSGSSTKIISKIETPGSIENIEEIVKHSDMVMIARGDLANSCDWKDLAKLSYIIADTANKFDTPWIVATQVALGTMSGPMMTRAEICDIWNWRKYGASAFMLSKETAWGPSPEQSVRVVNDYLAYIDGK